MFPRWLRSVGWQLSIPESLLLSALPSSPPAGDDDDDDDALMDDFIFLGLGSMMTMPEGGATRRTLCSRCCIVERVEMVLFFSVFFFGFCLIFV